MVDNICRTICRCIIMYDNLIADIYFLADHSMNCPLNECSKGADIYKQFISPHIEGDYIAICEGDDYWMDENKLQMQYDYMEKHPECSLCTHNTVKYDLNTKKHIFFQDTF